MSQVKDLVNDCIQEQLRKIGTNLAQLKQELEIVLRNSSKQGRNFGFNTYSLHSGHKYGLPSEDRIHYQ